MLCLCCILCALGFLEEESQTCYLDNVRGEAFNPQEIAAAQLHFNFWRGKCVLLFLLIVFFFWFVFISHITLHISIRSHPMISFPFV